MRDKRLWIALAVVIAASFAVLGFFGHRIYQNAPPIPARVVDTSGRVIFTGDDIRNGQNVWQSIGGQESGTVWGHGAYVAPDWSADWLHREATAQLDRMARERFGAAGFAALDPPRAALLREELRHELRGNSYSPRSGDIVVTTGRAAAIDAVGAHYDALFGGAPELAGLRSAYALAPVPVPDGARRHELNAFFFWAAWACITERPGTDVSYTQNWPPDPLLGNRPTSGAIVWSVISFVVLLGGIGALAWYYAVLRRRPEREHALPEWDPLLALEPTSSMRGTLKYFWVVAALLVVQIVMGAITAHYGVEGSGFYGIPLARWLPYAVTRTWHTQLGIFWIATAWLATGLFVAPTVGGREPRGPRAGVDFLFVALVVIVAGSMFGTWYATRQRMGLTMNYWFGHQGYEYVDLGRFWQIFLLVGLFLWLFLMVRALAPALRGHGPQKSLLLLFVISSAAIALFYGAGLMYGQHTNYAIAEYWRWWVVHLWVEGFFEVFATVVIAFLFTRMGLLRHETASSAVLFSTVIFLAGGIIGTFHHLYFSGTPAAVMGLGAVFSGLEVVPLVLIGFEAYENLTLSRARPWVAAYRWPIWCFIAVGFWNLVGAGLFGFLINPPVALYYMQGLNTTAVHAHTALFGVYGMLGIGLMLFCLKGLGTRRVWKTGVLAFSFWAINVGLALMVLLSDLPRGLMQTWASVGQGVWYARSAEFMHTGAMDLLRWLRVIGDTIFAAGVLGLGWFVLGLKTGWSVTGDVDRRIVPADGRGPLTGER